RVGAGLFLVGQKNESALNEVIREVRTLGADADGGLFDVGNYPEVQRLADAIQRRFSALDVVVNNAGMIKPAPLLEITAEQWGSTIRTHLHGTFYSTLEMVNRFMKPRGLGKDREFTAPQRFERVTELQITRPPKAESSGSQSTLRKEPQPLNVV